MKSKAKMIKEANNRLENPTNKEIKNYVRDNYNLAVLSQEIYSSIGPEKLRTATKLTPTQLSETKKLIRQNFGGDIDKATDAVAIIKDIAHG